MKKAIFAAILGLVISSQSYAADRNNYGNFVGEATVHNGVRAQHTDKGLVILIDKKTGKSTVVTKAQWEIILERSRRSNVESLRAVPVNNPAPQQSEDAASAI